MAVTSQRVHQDSVGVLGFIIFTVITTNGTIPLAPTTCWRKQLGPILNGKDRRELHTRAGERRWLTEQLRRVCGGGMISRRTNTLQESFSPFQSDPQKGNRADQSAYLRWKFWGIAYVYGTNCSFWMFAKSIETWNLSSLSESPKLLHDFLEFPLWPPSPSSRVACLYPEVG